MHLISYTFLGISSIPLYVPPANSSKLNSSLKFAKNLDSKFNFCVWLLNFHLIYFLFLVSYFNIDIFSPDNRLTLAFIFHSGFQVPTSILLHFSSAISASAYANPLVSARNFVVQTCLYYTAFQGFVHCQNYQFSMEDNIFAFTAYFAVFSAFFSILLL